MVYRHVTTRLAGLIILIAGIWGGLIPFLGPVFHFALGPDKAWTWTTGRFWLSVLPAIAAVLGGLILMGRGPHLSGRFGALLALAGGVWFAVGPDVSMLWNHGVSQVGVAHGHHTITRMLEQLTLHSGIGVLITALAAYSLPGVTALGLGRRRVERDAAIAGTGAAAGAAETRHRDRVAERRGTGATATGTDAAAGTGDGAGTGAAAGTGAGAGTGAAAREPAAATEGAPAAAGTAAAADRPGAAADRPVAATDRPAADGAAAAGRPAAADDAVAGQPATNAPAMEPAAANVPTTDPTAGGTAAAGTRAQPAETEAPTTRRRRGGLFSRR